MKIRFLQKKECTVLTWPGRIFVFVILLLTGYLVAIPFPLYLGKSKPVGGNYLVLDGQMPDYSIVKAIDAFKNNGYDSIIVTGGKLSAGYYVAGRTTMAELTYATFVQLGFDSTRIIVLPGGDVEVDRTYTSAIAIKKYFQEKNIGKARMDVFVIGCHAGRSLLLFQKALGENYEIGVFTIPDYTYNIRKWWKSSKGARTVISEIIAFVYVKLFFHPQF